MHSFPSIPFQRPDGNALPFELIPLQPFGSRPRFYTSYHRAAFTELWYVQEGVCEQSIDLKHYRLEPDCIGIVPRGAITLKGDTSSLGGWLIIFAEEFLTMEQQRVVAELSIFHPLSEQHLVSLRADERSEFDALMHLWQHEYRNSTYPYYQTVMQHLVMTFLLKLEHLVQQTQPDRPAEAKQMYCSFAQVLERHFTQQHSVEFYAHHLHTTPRKLSDALKEAVGKTTQELLLERLMVEAKRYLAYTTLTVKEIADALGFHNPFYFSRIFKKKVGRSPDHFKQHLAAQ
jgi:AraC-like DNA-binding protein